MSTFLGVSRVSAGGTEILYGLDGAGIEFRGGGVRTRPERPWRPPSILSMGTGSLSSGVKRLGVSVGHPPPSSAEVKERVDHTSTPSLGLHGLS